MLKTTNKTEIINEIEYKCTIVNEVEDVYNVEIKNKLINENVIEVDSITSERI